MQGIVFLFSMHIAWIKHFQMTSTLMTFDLDLDPVEDVDFSFCDSWIICMICKIKFIFYLHKRKTENAGCLIIMLELVLSRASLKLADSYKYD